MDPMDEQDGRAFTAHRIHDAMAAPEVGANLAVEPRLEPGREMRNRGVCNCDASDNSAGGNSKLDDTL